MKEHFSDEGFQKLLLVPVIRQSFARLSWMNQLDMRRGLWGSCSQHREKAADRARSWRSFNNSTPCETQINVIWKILEDHIPKLPKLKSSRSLVEVAARHQFWSFYGPPIQWAQFAENKRKSLNFWIGRYWHWHRLWACVRIRGSLFAFMTHVKVRILWFIGVQGLIQKWDQYVNCSLSTTNWFWLHGRSIGFQRGICTTAYLQHFLHFTVTLSLLLLLGVVLAPRAMLSREALRHH